MGQSPKLLCKILTVHPAIHQSLPRAYAIASDMLYYWRMNNWEAVQQVALGSHGIVTLAQAKAMGIFPAEMYRRCRNGRLMKVGRGVFRMTLQGDSRR